MSKFDDVLTKAQEQLTKLGITDIDSDMLRKIARGLGPSIYRADASLVSCGDETELDRVKRSRFVTETLGLEAGEALDNLIQAVCQDMKSQKRKMRVTFYYLLWRKTQK